MNPWPLIGKLVGIVPTAVKLVREAVRTRRPLAPPLGESEAAKALRLEDERRAAAAAEAALRDKEKGQGN